MRTLIVEDDFTARLLLQSFLSQYGESHIAVNGKEAVAAFRAAQDNGQRYNLICMDIMMPEMDGPTAVREIRALEEGRGTLSTYGTKIIYDHCARRSQERHAVIQGPVRCLLS